MIMGPSQPNGSNNEAISESIVFLITRLVEFLTDTLNWKQSWSDFRLRPKVDTASSNLSSFSVVEFVPGRMLGSLAAIYPAACQLSLEY